MKAHIALRQVCLYQHPSTCTHVAFNMSTCHHGNAPSSPGGMRWGGNSSLIPRGCVGNRYDSCVFPVSAANVTTRKSPICVTPKGHFCRLKRMIQYSLMLLEKFELGISKEIENVAVACLDSACCHMTVHNTPCQACRGANVKAIGLGTFGV